MARHRTVSVVGSINMDLVATTPRLPLPGETILGTGFVTVPGGKGSNQAIAAARAGGDVTFIGAVGEDAFGGELAGTLRQAGVSVDRLRRVAGPSGIAAISVDAAAENTIIVVPGANAALTSLTDADAASIRRSDLLAMQLEIPMGAVTAAAAVAREADVPVLLNPSPVADLPAELLAAVTVLVVNEGEADALGPAITAAVPTLIVTLGSRGARYRGPHGGTFDVAAPTVRAVDTTGAGDAFTGALAVALAERREPRDAVRLACAAGALATTVAGASASSPLRASIEELAGRTYR